MKKNETPTLDIKALRAAIAENNSSLIQFIMLIVKFAFDKIAFSAGKYYYLLEGKMPAHQLVEDYLRVYLRRNRSLVLAKKMTDFLPYLISVSENYIMVATLLTNASDNTVLYHFVTPYRGAFYGNFKQRIVYKFLNHHILSPTKEQVQSVMTQVCLNCVGLDYDITCPYVVSFFDTICSNETVTYIRQIKAEQIKYIKQIKTEKIEGENAMSHKVIFCNLDGLAPENDYKTNNFKLVSSVDGDEYTQDSHFFKHPVFNMEDIYALLSFSAKSSKRIRSALPVIHYVLSHGDCHGSLRSAIYEYSLRTGANYSAVNAKYDRAISEFKKESAKYFETYMQKY